MKKILSILICVVLGVVITTTNAQVNLTQIGSSGVVTITATALYNGQEAQDIAIVQTYGTKYWREGFSKKSEILYGTEGSKSSVSVPGYHGNYSVTRYDFPVNAKFISISEGYYFEGWYLNNPISGTRYNDPYKYDCQSDHNGTIDVYANVQPIVVTGAMVNNISISDINTSGQGTVVFDVTNSSDVDVNDFEYNIEGDGFSIVNKAYSNGKLTVTVQYTSQTTDNVNGNPKPEYSAFVTLTSKGGEAGAANKSQTATIKANISLVPTFTIVPTSYSFFDEYGIIANSESKTKTLIVTTSNKAAAASAYTYSLSDAVSGSTTFSGASNPYTIDATDPLQPVVKFTAPANGFYEDIQCTLTVYCTYTDAQSKQIVSEIKIVTLTADAGSVIKINNTQNASHDFGTTIYGTGASTSLPFTATVAYTEDWNATSPFTYTVNANTIDVNVPADAVPGDYNNTLNFTYDGDVVATLAVSAQVRLAKPVLTATADMGNAIQLDWTEVYGVTKYIVRSGATEVVVIGDDEDITNSFKVVEIGGTPLQLGQECSFTVTAIYDTENPYGTSVSDEVVVTTSVHSTITSTTELDLWTGTEKGGSYPYSLKRKVDLSAAFKDGKAIFDQLFIFGLTTGDASNNITVPTATTNSNAVTPCYIYEKDGNNYKWSSTIDNVNVATKPSAFNITASGQKIYFTGYAPYASCGSTWDENGVFFFSGSGTNLDLYLDNLELYARPKAITGTSEPTYIFDIYDIGDLGKFGNNLNLKIEGLSTDEVKVDMYTQGSGSALCFKSTGSAAFTPSIHLNGNNILQSTQGMFVTVDVNVEIDLWIKKFSIDYGPVTASQHSSPIQIIHDKATISNSTILTIDDLWGGSTRTNGALDLAAGTETRPAPTIDLGNENTTLQINGGQLLFSNSYNNSDDYVVSYAISYRMHSGMSGRAKMYGIGSDQPGGNVAFNDGTISCKPLPISQFNPDLYHNTTSMKCPWNTKIDGGTFNCDVLACATTTSKGSSPKNSNGDALCMIEIPIKSVNTNGTAVLTDDWMTYAKNKGASTSVLGYYGIESLTPETIMGEDDTEIQVVNLMLPSNNVCFVDMQLTHWVMCFPTLDVSGVKIGGPVEVPSSITAGDEGLTKIEKTSKLLYGEIDQLFMPEVIEHYQAPGGIMVELPNGYEDAYVKNTDSYVIYDKVYMLLPVMANQWKMFVPPFDVANVYVIESYPEKKLLEDFDTSTEDGIYNARYQQAWRMLDLFYQWVWNVDQLKNSSDFWSNHKSYAPIGKYESMGSFVQAWMDMYIQRDDKGKVTNDDYKPVIEQLYHYTSNPDANYPQGKYWWDANFYLYEADGDVWETKEEGGLKALWKEVPTVSQPRAVGANANQHEVIMHKGGKYVLNFPSTIVNSKEHDFWTNWDYWTGKYILLEGYPEEDIDSDGNMEPDDRGQVLAGSTTDWNGNSVEDLLLAEYDISGSAILRGNYTFSNVDISSLDNAYVLNTYQVGRGVNSEKLYPELSHNIYVLASGGDESVTDLTPSQGFILSNVSAPQGKHVRAINVKDGSVVYEEDNSNQGTTTSVPTIAGNKQMMVYNIEGGVGIVPVVEQQVSIYNAAGQLVTSQYLTSETTISLPAGIYLICGENEMAKAVVR